MSTVPPPLAAIFPMSLGDDVTLTPSTTAAAEETFAVVDAERERLREWLPWVDQTTSVEVSKGYLESVERVNAEGSGLHLTIRDAGCLAGFVDLRVAPMQRAGEVGYWLAEFAVGRSLMSRSVAAVVDLAFGVFDLHRVQLQAATENVRSRAVAERLGMTFEGVRREAEELARGFVDLAVYSVLAQEWAGAESVLPRPRADSPPAR